MSILSKLFGKKAIGSKSLDELIELASDEKAAEAIHSAMTMGAVGIGQKLYIDKMEDLLIKASNETGKTHEEIIQMTPLKYLLGSAPKTDNRDEEYFNDLPIKAVAFANAAVSIKCFFEQMGVPDMFQGILEEHSQEMCMPLYHELDLSDREWEDLDQDVLALMVLDRNLKEYHTKSIPDLFKYYLDVSCCVAGSMVDGHLEVKKNSITYDIGQKTMDSINNIRMTYEKN